MIEVTYHRKYHRLTVTGHALSDEIGKDMVCCAASTLAQTLAANVTELKEKGVATQIVTNLENGKAEISCTVPHRWKQTTTLIFDTVCAGFEFLRRNFPEYIRFEIYDG